MTKERTFKRHVRERMSKTGESYTAARAQVSQKRDRVRAAGARLAATAERPTDDKVEAATGRRWRSWFSILDRWGARERKHGETAAFLMDEHGVPGWWAQTITVSYQRERGMRLKHQQADGFTVYASKTIAVPPIGSSTRSSTLERGGDGSSAKRCGFARPSRVEPPASAGTTARASS